MNSFVLVFHGWKYILATGGMKANEVDGRVEKEMFVQYKKIDISK